MNLAGLAREEQDRFSGLLRSPQLAPSWAAVGGNVNHYFFNATVNYTQFRVTCEVKALASINYPATSLLLEFN